MTEPKKQDGTIELDVGQIDLLDLPLPPSSKKAVDDAPEERASKGPPPLPPTAAAADAAPAGEKPAEETPPVPSLPPPPEPRVTPAAAISARKLVGDADGGGSPMTRFLVGMGAASLLCVGAFFAFRALHKTPKPPPAPSAEATPAHTFTMAPIEFTEPAANGSASAAPPASAEPVKSAAPPVPSAAPTHSSAAPHASHAASTKPPVAGSAATGAPRSPDDLLKVEN